MTIGETLRRATAYLDARGVDTPRLDAELLLAKALSSSRLELYLEHDRPLAERELTACRDLVERRGSREPLAYVLGEWGFRRLTLVADGRALVPRPETEVVVERCLARLAGLSAPTVLDVGTGSGAIALAIADERPGAWVLAIDRSAQALELAAENVAKTELGERVRLDEHDARAGLPALEFDVVVSNPPYVSTEELATLEPEVRDWEPYGALVDDGTMSAIARGAVDALRPGGWLVLEVAEDRAGDVASELQALGYDDVEITRDLARRERVVEGRRP